MGVEQKAGPFRRRDGPCYEEGDRLGVVGDDRLLLQ
jgi:hypothetical protein